MNVKKIAVSALWGICACCATVNAVGSYLDSIYGERLARGGDVSVGDLGFKLLFIVSSIGLITFGLGLLGKLPGTK